MLKLIKESRTGPKPNFSDADVYWAMYLMFQGQCLYRKTLVQELEVGEGSVRTILNSLREAGMVDTYQNGSVLTRAGSAFMNALPIEPVDIDLPRLTGGPVTQAVHVRGAADRIRDGWDQRDLGVIAGGNGCTTVVYRDGRLLLPPEWDLDTENPDEASLIRGSLDLRDGDVLVVGSGDTVPVARRAAITVALSIV